MTEPRSTTAATRIKILAAALALTAGAVAAIIAITLLHSVLK